MGLGSNDWSVPYDAYKYFVSLYNNWLTKFMIDYTTQMF